MIISALKERKDSEKRVAIVPDIAKKLINDGHSVLIESDAGLESFFSNDLYKEVGAKILSLEDIVGITDILLSIDLPPEEILSKMKNNSCLVGLLNPFDNLSKFTEVKNKSMSVFSMELIPRITRAQSMDVLSSQANLAGYRAVITATSLYSKSMSMMMTAAGTVAPAKVFVMGVGVAGLQAIATAKRLGAIVSATDVRRAAAEQCESLGASFIMVDDQNDAEDESGYAKEMSEEYQEKQRQLISEHTKQQDIIICSALISGKRAPILLDEVSTRSMKPGSIIIDMAIERGGNCELSKLGETVEIGGVKIVGDVSLVNGISPDASSLFSRNLYSFLDILIDKEKDILNLDDEIIKEAIILNNGQVSKNLKEL